MILKVFDGDTVLIKTKEGTASVRLTGIDCYETHFNSHVVYQKTEKNSYEEIFEKGEMAKLRLEQLIKNKNIFLEITGMDKKYSRLVGILYTSDGMNINKEMLKNGYNIGGEQSGHIIMLDHATTGDGQLTAAMLVKVMQDTGKNLSELCRDIVDYPQLLVNVKITESGKGKWSTVPAITESISAAERELAGNGRVLVRESGTEPLVRVMVEGKDMEMVKRLADSIADEVRNSLT